MTPEIDPRDPSAVATALAGWASARFDSDVEVAGTPTAISGGFDSYIHRVELAGTALPVEWARPLVVRVLPSPDRAPQAEREAAVQTWCAAQGYPAPAVLAVLSPDDAFGRPAQVMELAPGTTMLAAVTARPWQALRLVDRLAGLARHLHALPVDGFPPPVRAERLVDQRLGLPRRVVAELDVPALAGALAHAEASADAAMTGPAVVCHGDFHPLNVMVDGDVGGRSSTGPTPGSGPVRPTSPARSCCSTSPPSRPTGPSSERRSRSPAPAWPVATGAPTRPESGWTPSTSQRWELLHAVHGWAQVEMLHAGGFDGASSASPDAVPDDVARFLQARVEALTAGP